MRYLEVDKDTQGPVFLEQMQAAEFRHCPARSTANSKLDTISIGCSLNKEHFSDNQLRFPMISLELSRSRNSYNHISHSDYIGSGARLYREEDTIYQIYVSVATSRMTSKNPNVADIPPGDLSDTVDT